MLSNCLRGMKRKAHGAQEPRHIWKYVEVTSTAQRGDSPAQAINQRFLKSYGGHRKDDKAAVQLQGGGINNNRAKHTLSLSSDNRHSADLTIQIAFRS